MFGYIRPLKSELKVREFEQFKSCYCSMCHYLKRHYGLCSTFILNYDFTFLTMLLWERDCAFHISRKRCIANPLRKKCVCGASDSMDKCAAYSVILTYWKLRDEVEDEAFFRGLPARAGKLFLHRAYKKAAKGFPVFDSAVRERLLELSRLEKAGESSLDKMADQFARILVTIGMDIEDAARRRVIEQLLYQMGRWIYILDACDDFEEDVARRRYNPIGYRFSGLEKLGEEEKAYLKTTLKHSQNLIFSAFGLLDETVWTEIINNIICLGMPDACDKVFSGTFSNRRGPFQTDWRKINERSV